MNTLSRFFIPRRGALLALSLALAGCNRNEVGSYRVAKEKEGELPVTAPAGSVSSPALPAGVPAHNAAAAPGGDMAGAPLVTASGAGLTWSAPSTWQSKPLGAMRKGSFVVSGDAGATADLSITAFPGAVGGELANLNRWRGQLALPPIADSELETSVVRLSQNGLAFTVVDLVGADPAKPQRILGAMVPYEGAMWFFKLTGPDALVAATKSAFTDFLKTVKAAAPVSP